MSFIKETEFVVKAFPQTRSQSQVKNLPKEKTIDPKEEVTINNSVYEATFTLIPNQRHCKKNTDNIPPEYKYENKILTYLI